MSKRGLAVLIASFCTVFTQFAIRLSYGVLLPEMLLSLEISKTEAGLIYSWFFITYTVFSPVLGLMADRIDIRLLLTVFSAILGIGTFLMAYSSSLLEASFFFAVTGIGASACWSPVVALAQRWVSDKRRGITLAFIDAGGSVGIALSSLVMPLVVMASSWRMGWQILGTVAFLLVALNFLLVRSHPGGQSTLRNAELSPHTSKPFKAIYVSVLRDGRFWFIGLSYLLIGFSGLIPVTFLSTYAVQELTFPYKVATGLITIIYIASTGGKFILGPLSDILGRIRILVICAAMMAVSSLGMVFYHGIWPLSLFAGIFGLSYGGVWPLYAACASDYFSKRAAGGIVGLWTLLLGIGLVLSPIIAGWTADTTGTLAWSFILAVATAMISSLLLLPVGKAHFAGGAARNK